MDADKLLMEAEKAYVSGSESYADIASRIGYAKTMVSRYGKAHDWPRKRKEYRQRVTDRAIAISEKRQAEALARVAAIDLTLIDRIERMLADDQQLQRHLVTSTFTDEDGMKITTTEEKVFKKADTRALRDLAASVDQVHKTLRAALGLPTQAEAEAQRIAAERLKLEQERAAFEREKGERSGDITVVFEDGMEELTD